MVTEITGSTMSSATRSLGSWKEIAHYLNVNPRTAQKWERDKALPVHRNGGVRGRVWADATALDAWKQQQQVREPDPEEQSYRWPLGSGLVVEVRFEGEASPTAEHIDLLRNYLDLFKTTLK